VAMGRRKFLPALKERGKRSICCFPPLFPKVHKGGRGGATIVLGLMNGQKKKKKKKGQIADLRLTKAEHPGSKERKERKGEGPDVVVGGGGGKKSGRFSSACNHKKKGPFDGIPQGEKKKKKGPCQFASW